MEIRKETNNDTDGTLKMQKYKVSNDDGDDGDDGDCCGCDDEYDDILLYK